MERVVRIAKELVSIESETKNEKEVGECIYPLLKECGMKPEKQFFEDGRFNVICFGFGPLIINGHMDTVPIGKNWTKNSLGELVGDKLYGRGSSDTKGNIACMIAALESNPTNNITVVFNCQEENGFEGIMKVLELRETKLEHIKYSLSLEPTDGRILHCNKGQYTFEINTKGKAVHSSMPEKGENAIKKLVSLIEKLNKYEKELAKRKHEYVGHATINIAQVKGGIAPNVVPDSAGLIVDRRVLPGETGVVEEFKKVVEPFELKPIKRIPPAETPENSKIIKFMQKIVNNNGFNPEPKGLVATSELSAYREFGIEGVIFGTLPLEQAHMADEHVLIKDLIKGEKVFVDLIKNVGDLDE